MGAVVTTVQVSFSEGGAGAGHLSAEVDSRPDGLNAGRTSFAPGDPVHILVYKSPNVSINNVEASAGSIHPGPQENIEVTDILTFNNSREASLSKPAAGGLSVTWYGASLGALAIGADGVSVQASKSGVAVAKVVYQTAARSYRLSSPLEVNGEKNYQILVLIIGNS